MSNYGARVTPTRVGKVGQPSQLRKASITGVQNVEAGNQSVSSGISTPTTESLTDFDARLSNFIAKNDANTVVDENGDRQAWPYLR